MKRWIQVLIAALGVAALVFGVQRYQRWRAPPKPSYSTVSVDRGRIASKVTATGTLSALVTVLVGSQVSGRIESIKVDFNSPVTKGQVIATIEPALFQAAVDQARANYFAAVANVEKSKAQSIDADRQFTRAKALGTENLVAKSEVESAEANANVARSQIAAAQAGVQQANASLHQADVNLKYTTILSPIDGVVISRSIDVGQTVAASLQAPTLFTIAQDLTKMQVDTNVAEGDVGKVRPGMRVTFNVDAYPGQRFEGIIRQIRDAPQTIQNVVTYDAVIDVDNGKRQLKPGMTATVSFTPAEKNDVLRIPNAALRYRPEPTPGASARPRDPSLPRKGQAGSKTDKRTVWRLRADQANPVEIQIGLSDGSVTEVMSGDLHEGDVVITELITDASAKPSSAGRMF